MDGGDDGCWRVVDGWLGGWGAMVDDGRWTMGLRLMKVMKSTRLKFPLLTLGCGGCFGSTFRPKPGRLEGLAEAGSFMNAGGWLNPLLTLGCGGLLRRRAGRCVLSWPRAGGRRSSHELVRQRDGRVQDTALRP